MWVTRLSIVDWVYSKTQTLFATLRNQNQPRTESCVSLEAEHLSPKVGCVRNKQTSVSHSSTESEIISLDAGLRMDGLPALDLWDVVIEGSRSTNNTKRPIRQAPGNWCGIGSHSSNKTKQLKGTTEMLFSCQMWTTYPQTHILLKGESQLYIFEDNEAVEPKI